MAAQRFVHDSAVKAGDGHPHDDGYKSPANERHELVKHAAEDGACKNAAGDDWQKRALEPPAKERGGELHDYEQQQPIWELEVGGVGQRFGPAFCNCVASMFWTASILRDNASSD